MLMNHGDSRFQPSFPPFKLTFPLGYAHALIQSQSIASPASAYLQMSTSLPHPAHSNDDKNHRQQQITAAILLATLIVLLRLFNFSERVRLLLAPSIRWNVLLPVRSISLQLLMT
jgi:hypothetical protein